MAFKKKVKKRYPPRMWELVGFPGSGKSTFATQMVAPLLPVDADQRFDEVLPLVEGDVYELSETAADHTDPRRVAELLEAGMPGAEVGTIVVDSLTTIIAPLVTKALLNREQAKNKVAIFQEKALTMRLLQDTVSKWGVAVLWIYHLQTGRNGRAQAVTSATIPRTERARLLRSLNLRLEVAQEEQRRGIKVVWARRGRVFPDVPVLWDDTGRWVGMPEKIEAAVYDGLSEQARDRIESDPPDVFVSCDAAIAWGFERGVFKTLQNARNTYDKLKAEGKPQSAREMAALWVAAVGRRKKDGEKRMEERATVTQEAFYERLSELMGTQEVVGGMEKRAPLAGEIELAKASGSWGDALRCLEAQKR